MFRYSHAGLRLDVAPGPAQLKKSDGLSAFLQIQVSEGGWTRCNWR